MYDLKKMLEESGNKVPSELYQQDAALAPKGLSLFPVPVAYGELPVAPDL